MPAARTSQAPHTPHPKEGIVEREMKGSYWFALVLLVIGGLNWLLVGAFDFDLVAAIFGPMTTASRVVYVLVGIAAIWTLIASARMRRPDNTYRGEPTISAR
jgi:uncharacterized membrane protein YuzA (DUF378 family)